MNNPFDNKRRRLLQAIACLPGVGMQYTQAASNRQFIQKKIPKSGELIPAVGIGTSRVFDVGNDPLEREGPLAALASLRAFDNAMIDTSPMYGAAEKVIGELLPQLQPAGNFFLATKVWTEGKQEGIEQMNRSFSRLASNTIDLMQIHNLVDWQVQLETLREWKALGRIRYIGITHYREDMHDELIKVIQQIPDLDFLQINYSLLEPEAERHLLPVAQENAIAVIANRPFARGNWFAQARHHQLPQWAADEGIHSWAQFALKWVISHPAISCAIPGTRKAKHMLDNMGAASGSLLNNEQRLAMQKLVNNW